MYRVRWDRILVLFGLFMAPLALRWLFRNTNIGGVYAVPLIGDAVCHSPETKALILLMLILTSVVMIVKTLRD